MSYFSGQCWSMEKISRRIFSLQRGREIMEDTWLCQAHSSVEIRGPGTGVILSGGSQNTNWFCSL